MLRLTLADGRLKEPSDIVTICHYLRETLICKWNAFYWKPQDEVAVLSPKRWHVTFHTKEHQFANGMDPVPVSESSHAIFTGGEIEL